MPGHTVHIVGGPPHEARLIRWGRTDAGWYGLVTFEQPLRAADGNTERVPIAAWVPAARLNKPAWVTGGDDLPRQDLGPDQALWPGPDRWRDGWFAGAWIEGPLPVPSGSTIETG